MLTLRCGSTNEPSPPSAAAGSEAASHEEKKKLCPEETTQNRGNTLFGEQTLVRCCSGRWAAEFWRRLYLMVHTLTVAASSGIEPHRPWHFPPFLSSVNLGQILAYARSHQRPKELLYLRVPIVPGTWEAGTEEPFEYRGWGQAGTHKTQRPTQEKQKSWGLERWLSG